MCILYTYHMEYETCWVARCDRLSMWDMTCRHGMKLSIVHEIWLTLVYILFIFVLSPKMILIHHVTFAYLHDLIVSCCIFQPINAHAWGPSEAASQLICSDRMGSTGPPSYFAVLRVWVVMVIICRTNSTDRALFSHALNHLIGVSNHLV